MISLPRFDDPHHERYWEAETHRHMVHKAGHYFWRGPNPWIGEGAATFGEAVVEASVTGRPLVMDTLRVLTPAASRNWRRWTRNSALPSAYAITGWESGYSTTCTAIWTWKPSVSDFAGSI